MKKISLQWRITLMTALLIGVTCIAMNLLLCSSGIYYMDSIADTLQGSDRILLDEEDTISFDPQVAAPDGELTILIDGAQGRFRTTNWYITAVVTALSGILAYFVSGHALKPLRSFASQTEKVQLNNLADIRINENVLPEFRQLGHSLNQMLERLNNAFSAQKQFTGNAAHELRTPLALMQAQLELFCAEHPDMLPETADFLSLLQEQTERLSQMTKTLLEMSNLQQVERNESIQLAPMVEEIFTDLTPLAEKSGITLELAGDGVMTGSDALIYRMIFNLTDQIQSSRRFCTGLHHPGARKASDPCFRYGTGNSGGISAEYLSALLPCRQIPQPNLRRCRAWSCTGMGDCKPSRRLCPGCRKLRQRNHHRCRAATLRQSCSRSQKRNALETIECSLCEHSIVMNQNEQK